ncbi:Transcription factor A, mitochondrial [Ooceraea biroi]|uniref:Transcription factor A, mitochondrial n=1 Tax=Ooceraea biroi TaxID=2015173 RepID=A0A026WY97_OOCBI|nr:Transcription factor A, mitochondrial [Ooceraea biroi]
MEYENSITSDQKMLVKEELRKKELAWEKNQIKQKLVALGKPKRPLNAFYLFVQSKRVTKDPLTPQKDWMSKISKEWKDMTMDAKNKYVTEATKLFENYKVDVKKWEQDMIQAGHHDLLKPSIKSKQCPNQIKTEQIIESITTDHSDVRTQIEDNDKTGWGTNIAHRVPRKIYDDVNTDQHYGSTKSLVLYDNRKNLQYLMKYSKDAAKDASKNYDIKSERQVRDTYTQMYKYFISLWNRLSAILCMKKISRNWKMVREYVFIGTAIGTAIVISIFCVLNLMYK